MKTDTISLCRQEAEAGSQLATPVRQRKTFLCTIFCIAAIYVPCAMASGKNTTDTPSFTAFGTQSAWRAVMEKGQLSLEGEEIPYQIFSVRHLALAKNSAFYGRKGKETVFLNIRNLSCKDRNGYSNGYTAILVYKGNVMKGCAVAGAIEYAPT